MTLSDDEIDRYARHIVLKEIGGTGQLRLKAARAVVIGAGGIGSPVIQYLAAAGVGRVDILDDDRVEASNLQRQTIYATDDVGHGKAEVAAAKARAINPHVDPRAVVTRVEARNATDLITGADVVIDGCDNFATRLVVADAALVARVPLVSAAVGQFEGQLAVYRGWEAAQPCYRCLVGDPADRPGDTCADQGIIGPVTGILGSLAALEAIRAIVPFGEDPAGKLLVADLLAWRFRTLRLAKDPGCPTCATLPQTPR